MESRPLCIVPARGGSKRIARKNIVDFNGQPLMAWALSAALESGVFSRVVVSTDDREIADVARASGAEVPFMRSGDLADDFTGTAAVLIDAVQRCGVEGEGYACCLYPAAAMVDAQDLKTGLAMAEERDADCVLSVCEYDFPPLRALTPDKQGGLSFHWPEHAGARSQDLPAMLHDAGMFYFFRIAHLMETGALLGGRSFGVPIPRARAVDIDTPEDLALARILHANSLKGA